MQQSQSTSLLARNPAKRAIIEPKIFEIVGLSFDNHPPPSNDDSLSSSELGSVGGKIPWNPTLPEKQIGRVVPGAVITN